VIARTRLGALRGRVENGVVAFRGVPYAAPPIGPRRFAPPEPPEPWSDTRDATQNGPIAPQLPSRLSPAMGDFNRHQDEDCLTLCIWTPAADDARRPVLIWLHGGAWSSGAGSLAWYDGGRLARENDIVVVGVNYRLGALGYLYASGVSPGNLGSGDQVAALRWVHANIAGFGGDPNRITVAGQSAGAASIGRMLLDSDARPLFQRAILQSGGFGRVFPNRAAAAELGAAYLRLLGLDPDVGDFATRLRAMPVERLLQAQGHLARTLARFADTTPAFVPFVENSTDWRQQVAEIAEAARNMDVLIGSTREETRAFYAVDPAMADPPADAVARRFQDLAGSTGAMEGYRRRRPGGSTMELLSDLVSDHTFTWPSLRLAEAIAERGGRVYAYQFDWAPPGSRFGACHCIELPFVFGTLDSWPGAGMLAGGDAATMAALSAEIRGRWAGFVRDGSPGQDWPRYSADRRATMVFGEVCGPMGDPAGLGCRT
jgi:para-nitrobenzyl esterase